MDQLVQSDSDLGSGPPPPPIGLRGGDIDKGGVLWGSGSNGTLVSFDRRKCKGPLNGPTATGNHCPEGFAQHKYPGPSFEGFENGSAEASYYSWVDHHNTVGLGENIPISTANLNDGFVTLKDGQMVMLRIPYPLQHCKAGSSAFGTTRKGRTASRESVHRG